MCSLVQRKKKKKKKQQKSKQFNLYGKLTKAKFNFDMVMFKLHPV